MGNHRYGDERIVDWLNEPREWNYPRDVPYHPRSDTHGGAQCRFFLDDLVHESDTIREEANNGNLVYMEDFSVGDGGLEWNTDLVVGPPSNPVQREIGESEGIQKGEPEDIWLAVDAKSIMTEHQKARRNRLRDINSFASIMHIHYKRALSAGILLVNIADKFDSPTRPPDDITKHPNIERIVEKIVDIFDSIHRSGGEVSANLDGLGMVVVEHSNLVEDIGSSRLLNDPPAPQIEDRVHYRTFVRQIASMLESRFLSNSLD